MIKDKFGQMIFTEDNIFDSIMLEPDMQELGEQFYVEDLLSAEMDIINEIAKKELVKKYIEPDISVEEFDRLNQQNWHMLDNCKNLDIAEYTLSLCSTQEELQRCGEELLLYQERNLFNLLRYLKYLVDIMEENNIIWGVGRGSSVSSYVLFKLKVHRIDSMYYNLDVTEFLR